MGSEGILFVPENVVVDKVGDDLYDHVDNVDGTMKKDNGYE